MNSVLTNTAFHKSNTFEICCLIFQITILSDLPWQCAYYLPGICGYHDATILDFFRARCFTGINASIHCLRIPYRCLPERKFYNPQGAICPSFFDSMALFSCSFRDVCNLLCQQIRVKEQADNEPPCRKRRGIRPVID